MSARSEPIIDVSFDIRGISLEMQDALMLSIKNGSMTWDYLRQLLNLTPTSPVLLADATLNLGPAGSTLSFRARLRREF